MPTIYEGNTDQTFLNLIHQASSLPQASRPWRNVGPFNGVVDIPGVGSGNEGFGPVDGIGTAIAVDPSDRTGSTVYLGTIGGLYKTTDGGKSVIDIGGSQLARDAIGAVAVDPADPNTVYAGTGVSLNTLSDDAAGVGTYVSHDKGRTWTRPASNTHGYGTNAISVGAGGTVLVGTNYGLWRSTDHGASFQPVPLPDNATHTGAASHPLGSWVTAIVRNPANEQEVTLAVGYAQGKKVYPDGEVIGTGNGLYRSTDGGATWSYMPSTAGLVTAADSPDPFGRTSLAYSTAPGTTGVLWAMVADAGKTAGAHSCVDTPAVPVCLDGGSVLNGVYRSGNDGATWQIEATPQILATSFFGTTSLAGNAIGYGPGVQGQYNNWIVADPVDPDRIYIGLEETFTGEFHDPTAGALPAPTTSWAAVEKYANVCGFLTYYNTIPNSNGLACPSLVPGYGSGTSHPDQHIAAFATTPTGFRMYSGNDGGWWSQDAHIVSDSSAVTYSGFENGGWNSLGQPPTVLPWDVARLQDGTYLLALQDNGVAHVRPDGTAYQVCGGDGVYVFPGANPSSYYCGIDGQGILATTDDMKTTITVTPSNNVVGATFLSPWTVDQTNSDHLLAASGNVDETLDGPRSNTYDPAYATLLSSTWRTVFTPPKAPHTPWDSSAVFARGNVEYVAFCSACRPSLSTGTAATAEVVTDRIATNVKVGCKAAAASPACWHMAPSAGLPHEQVSGIAVDPNDPETIYVSLRQLLVLGADPKVTGAQKVMVSHDAGASFTDLTGNLPSADAHRIELRDGRLYVATDVGIFTARVAAAATAAANAVAWSRFDRGLPEVTYRSMKLDSSGRYLVAGAYGRGGWVYDLGAPVPAAAPGPTTPATAGAGGSARGTNAGGGSSTGAGSAGAAARPASGVLGHTGIDVLAIVLAGLILIVVGFYVLVVVRNAETGIAST
ncbi:MAG: hypothetical protein NVS1B12_13000 [Acidimicrobiales bacterium]